MLTGSAVNTILASYTTELNIHIPIQFCICQYLNAVWHQTIGRQNSRMGFVAKSINSQSMPTVYSVVRLIQWRRFEYSWISSYCMHARRFTFGHYFTCFIVVTTHLHCCWWHRYLKEIYISWYSISSKLIAPDSSCLWVVYTSPY